MSVYFLRDMCCGLIKIGFSEASPKARVSGIQTSSPHKLELIGIIDGDLSTEYELHAMLDSYRVRGEWFAPESRVIETIVAMLLDEHGDTAKEAIEKLQAPLRSAHCVFCGTNEEPLYRAPSASICCVCASAAMAALKQDCAAQ